MGAINFLYDLKIIESIEFIFEREFKYELDQIKYLKVIKKASRFQWGAPTFLIPKEYSIVRFISDFRELNKRILRRPYPIPKIQDLLLILEGLRDGTTLDLNMRYYHMNSRSNKNSIDSSILRL